MYGVEWDNESGGIKLLKRSTGKVLPNVRPVFWEELDLLGFNKFWKYPQSEEPILWAVGREYYYKGKLVAKATGGGFFHKPDLKIFEEDLTLEPVDLDQMLELNKDILEGLINSTLDSIRNIYLKNKNKVDIIAVSFSGGKDSTVLLDLVQRVIPPTEFVVIFNDTNMELSPTYEYVNTIKKRYKNLKFMTAKTELRAPEMWKKMGPPSRVHRWCCSVYKSTPTIKLIRKLTNKDTPILLLFDGVRSDESRRRTNLGKVLKEKNTLTSQGKYLIQRNSHPLLYWNSAEVYLYLLYRNIPLNRLYRMGLRRVGCAVCPFGSQWKETIMSLAFANEIKPYLDVIKEYAKTKGISDENEIREFIEKGYWKMRIGGSDLKKEEKVILSKSGEKTTVVISNPNENLFEWVKTIGSILVSDTTFILNFEGRAYNFTRKESPKNKHQVIIEYNNENTPEKLQSLIKLVAYKTADCVHCRVCEAVCPTNAIDMSKGKVKINKDRCINCHTCLTFTNRGCLASDSLRVNMEVKSMKKDKGFSRYKGFGIRTEWVEEFFKNPEDWWSIHTLGPQQFNAMKHWLNESEIIKVQKGKYTITNLGRELLAIGSSDLFVWGILWNNLARNSPIIQWYLNSLEWKRTYTLEDIFNILGEGYAQRTKKNILSSLRGIFDRSPIGEKLELGIVIKQKNKTKGITKAGLNTRNLQEVQLSMLVLYSLYRYAEVTGRYSLTISELYENNALEGPYKVFGIEKEVLERILPGLSELIGQDWIKTEIIADLDNIFLSPKKNSVDVIGIYKNIKEKK